MGMPVGRVPPNQVLTKAAILVASPSIRMADWPGAIVVTPLRATALAKLAELSSIFQPVISTALALRLVTSNQSAATPGLLLLDQGATSEMISVVGFSVASVMAKVKVVLASGVAPTLVSSTLTVT